MEGSLNEPLAVAVVGVFSEPVYRNCFPQLVSYSQKYQKQNSILKCFPQKHTVTVAQYSKRKYNSTVKYINL